MADTIKFTTGERADESEVAEEPFEFELDGVPMQAKRPKGAVFSTIAQIESHRTKPLAKIRMALDFLESAVLEPGRTTLRERLLDPDDKLDIGDVIPILKAIADFWHAHPRPDEK
jgi:hypothetical protein